MKYLFIVAAILFAQNFAHADACEENLNLVCYSEFLKMDESTTWGPSESTDVSVQDDSQPDLCTAHMVLTTILGQVIADYDDGTKLLAVKFQTGNTQSTVFADAPISTERIKHAIIPITNSPTYKAIVLSCSLYSNN